MDIGIKRVFNADFINTVANDPSVKGGAKIEGCADLAELVGDCRNVLLTYSDGGFLCLWRDSGVYEVHTMALKSGRGKMLRSAITGAMEYMFFQTDCERLITQAHSDNKAAVALSEHYFNNKGCTEGSYYYELFYRDWVETSERAINSGSEFHGDVETNHEDDDKHDAHVGGAIEILKAGNPVKAIKLYNEWAVMSSYEPIVVLGISPLIASMGDMKLIYHNNELEQILCQ